MAENNGKLKHGQQFDPKDNFAVRYTEQDMPKVNADALLGNTATEIDPIDRQQSRVRVYTVQIGRAHV